MSDRVEFDVVVAGASCAGLRAAQLLAQAGLRVAVYERQKVLGLPSRTLIVTNELINVLGFVPDGAIVHQIDGMELISNQRTTRVNLESPDLIVERAAMVQQLGRMAEAAGAELYFEHSVQGLQWQDDGVELLVARNGSHQPVNVRTRTLIAADGAGSLLARMMGARPQVTAPIVQARVRLPNGCDPRVVRVWFNRDHTRFFYWLIPDSEGHGVVGLVADSTSNARCLLDEFMKEHDLRPLSYQGAVIPLHHPARQIEWRRGESRILLVGDAAAHVKVTTVGGLVSGLWGAQAAAESVIKGTSYSAELRGLHRELYLHDLIRWIMDRFGDSDYDRLLALLNGPLRELLARHNRDSMSPVFYALLAAQPSLIFLGARAILLPYRESPRQARSKSLVTVAKIDEC